MIKKVTDVLGRTDIEISGEDLPTLYRKVPSMREVISEYSSGHGGRTINTVRMSETWWKTNGWGEPLPADPNPDVWVKPETEPQP
jgi:hypothetical protein